MGIMPHSTTENQAVTPLRFVVVFCFHDYFKAAHTTPSQHLAAMAACVKGLEAACKRDMPSVEGATVATYSHVYWQGNTCVLGSKGRSIQDFIAIQLLSLELMHLCLQHHIRVSGYITFGALYRHDTLALVAGRALVIANQRASSVQAMMVCCDPAVRKRLDDLTITQHVINDSSTTAIYPLKEYTVRQYALTLEERITTEQYRVLDWPYYYHKQQGVIVPQDLPDFYSGYEVLWGDYENAPQQVKDYMTDTVAFITESLCTSI